MDTIQNDINQNMRGILVDWLVEVAEEYKLSSENLYLSTNYVDRFLSVIPVLRGKLQLVGVSCMLIASKYEEIFAPQVEDFVYITDNTYTAEEVGIYRLSSRSSFKF
jgi:cyclin-A